MDINNPAAVTRMQVELEQARKVINYYSYLITTDKRSLIHSSDNLSLRAQQRHRADQSREEPSATVRKSGWRGERVNGCFTTKINKD